MQALHSFALQTPCTASPCKSKICTQAAAQQSCARRRVCNAKLCKATGLYAVGCKSTICLHSFALQNRRFCTQPCTAYGCAATFGLQIFDLQQKLRFCNPSICKAVQPVRPGWLRFARRVLCARPVEQLLFRYCEIDLQSQACAQLCFTRS